MIFGCERMLRSDDGGMTFRHLPARPLTSPSCIEEAVFPSTRTGFVLLGDGTVLRTHDGGASFENAAPLPERGHDLAFADEQTGYGSSSSPSGGAIYRTTDGGTTWSSVAEVGGVGDIEPAGSEVVYALAGGGLLRSDDGGSTWTSRPLAGLPPNRSLYSLACVGVSRCLITAARGSDFRLLLTDDGGATVAELPGTGGAYVAAPASAGRAVAVGELGVTFVSDDGGVSFDPVGGGSGPLVDGPLRVAGPRSAYAVPIYSGHELIRTRSSGRSWSFVDAPLGAGEDVYDHWFASPRSGVLLALRETRSDGPDRARLLRTDDGGESWRTLARDSSRRLAGVAMLSGRRVLAGGADGVGLSTDGGRRFRPASGARGAALWSFDRGRGVVAAYGPRALAVSRDAGGRWRRIAHPGGRLAEVDFVDRQLAYLVTRAGALYRTAAGGRRWQRLLGAGARAASGVSFSDRRNGYLDVSSPRSHFDPFLFGDDSSVATLLRTSDGGRSWRPQFRVRGNRVQDVAALTPRSAIVASGGDLAWTGSGGDAPVATRLTISARRSRSRPRLVTISGPADARGRRRANRGLGLLARPLDDAPRRGLSERALRDRAPAGGLRRRRRALGQRRQAARRGDAPGPDRPEPMRITPATTLLAVAVLLGLGTPAAAALPTPFPSAGGWFWGNPLPQGGDLTEVDLFGARGFTAGGGRNLLTEDAGASWRRSEHSLGSVRFVDADTVIAIGECGELLRSDDGGSQFRELRYAALTGPACGHAFAHFPTPEVGYVTDGGTLYRTKDGGATFEVRAPVSARKLLFTSADVGFGIADDAIYRTVDGAKTWSQVASSTTSLIDVDFPDAEHGYAVGFRGTLLRSRDGGITWERAPAAGMPDLHLHDVRCADANTCLMTGETPKDDIFPEWEVFDSGIVRTMDGGESVQRVSSERVLALDYSSATRVVAVGRRGLMLTSDDGGVSFREVSHGSQDSYSRLSRASERVVYALGGRTGLGRSEDGGRSWNPVELVRPPRRPGSPMSISSASERVS